MKSNQREYIEYARDFADTHSVHIWLGGSFLRGNPTPFSDVDISALMNRDELRDFIYGYGSPIYLSYTTNPEGIVIVIYEDGVAVDLEVIESIDVKDEEYFHEERIKNYEYLRNNRVCKDICSRIDEPYQTERLFHRSLIKYLGGKKEAGVSLANEIVEFIHSKTVVTESDYRNGISNLIEEYNREYPLDAAYLNLCRNLIELVDMD